jgi:AmmeMemoRadiSam system protein A
MKKMNLISLVDKYTNLVNKDVDGKLLLKVARQGVERAVGVNDSKISADAQDWMKKSSGVFVTLKKDGKLRGCIGHIFPRVSVVQGVIENAMAAATRDSRFQPVRPEEVSDLEIEVSVLTEPEPLEYGSPEGLLEKLRPGVDGVVLRKGGRQSTFLPQVWEEIPEPEQFLGQLSKKAGLSRDAWKNADILTYQVESFQE